MLKPDAELRQRVDLGRLEIIHTEQLRFPVPRSSATMKMTFGPLFAVLWPESAGPCACFGVYAAERDKTDVSIKAKPRLIKGRIF